MCRVKRIMILASLFAIAASLCSIRPGEKSFLLTAGHWPLITALAQSATATLSGTVVDQNGAAIPNASISVLNEATALERRTTTNHEGTFIVPLLPPGRYTVTAQEAGFSPVKIPNVVLNVNDQRALQIQLKVGDISETVTIEAASLIRASAVVGTVIDRRFVGNLPLNGRSFQSLILLTPGVVATTQDTYNYGQFSVNGQRANTNYFTVDGVSGNIGMTTDVFNTAAPAYAGTVPGLSAFGGTNNLVSVDALEEFKIQTSSYTAEFGRQPGGQVQLVTRSGTNQIHGSMFEYFRNDVFDAREYFNAKPSEKPPLRQNQFGGTFSGPVFLPGLYNGRDRTFFFFSYEGQRLRLPRAGITDVPSVRVREAAAPAMRPLLNAFPLPTGPETLADDDYDPSTPDVLSGVAPYNYSVSDQSTMDATSIRLDHTISSKLTLFGRFNESPSESLSYFYLTTPERAAASTRTLTLGATSALTPTLNNEFRFNYSRQRGRQSYLKAGIGGAVPVDVDALTTGYRGSGKKSGWMSFSFAGEFSDLFTGDVVDSYQRQINIVDNVSLVRGTHHLKFGIDYRQLAPILGPREYEQRAFFYSEQGVINGTADSIRVFASQGARPIFDNYSMYAQDTWKVSPHLTLDLGLRWELNPAPHEANGLEPAVVIGVSSTDVSGAMLAPAGTPLYKTFYTALAPRAGAAYQIARSPGWETVLRGGFGVYYDLGSNTATSGFSAAPFSVSAFRFDVPYPVPPELAAPPPFSGLQLPIRGLVYSPEPNLTLPYTLQWNIAVEQSLGAQQSVSVSYVAAIARRLLMTQALNAPMSANGPRPNPNFSEIQLTRNGPSSDYHSLQAQYQCRWTHGLQALMSYTWSHAIDEVSNEFLGWTLVRGNASFDVRHNFSAAFTYSLPSVQTGPVLMPLFRNWSIDGIVHAQSGWPVDIDAAASHYVDGQTISTRPDLVLGAPLYVRDPSVPGGRRFNSAALQPVPTDPDISWVSQRQGTLGRNVFRGLPLHQIDLAVGRTFNVSEHWKLQFKAEAFNVFNRPNFGGYDNYFYPGNTQLGVPTTTLNRSLGGLSSLYQIGGPRSIQFVLRLGF